MVEKLPRGRYRLLRPARSFGGTLEWYVARELKRRLGFEVATALALACPRRGRGPGRGGTGGRAAMIRAASPGAPAR
ncbi:MAG: hypothetical protein HY901_02705 [Deltaproteobacteria bacterium]|nr:hypothetical protein [Deltaproteobacteria bacterium]